jgi:hypothetical protein
VSPDNIDHRPLRGGFPGADAPLAIHHRLAEADCWSDATLFQGRTRPRLFTTAPYGALRSTPGPSAVVQVIPFFAPHCGGRVTVFQMLGLAPSVPAFHVRGLRGFYGLRCAARRFGESVLSRRAGDGG